jgi:transcriptional regulator GlxA family with amidase domain
MSRPGKRSVQALIVAVPETAGSALYGLLDVLASAGSIWQTLVGEAPGKALISPRIVSTRLKPFRCGNRIPVAPDVAVEADPKADIVIIPELWLGPDEDMRGRYPELMDWIRRRYQKGATIYSACSGSILLAETGLLKGRAATSHWAYRELFSNRFPDIDFRPEPNLVFADATGRIVTAGGTTSWHDLAIHIIARHCSPGEALRIAKVYLLKWHGEGQLPYDSLVKGAPHADAVVRRCQNWLAKHFREPNAVTGVERAAAVAPRTLKRRFKAATGSTLIDHVQNLRVEEAKRRLETTDLPVDTISLEVGYEDPAFFRRLFKRRTGLKPSEYRRMFQPIARSAQRVGGVAEPHVL